MPELMSPQGAAIAWALAGYLLGSIPFGMVVARLMGLGNLREIGSGNIGATNVLRTGNKKAAALTLLFDAGKGAAIVLLARAFVPDDIVELAALAAFVGHCFPIWLKFKGGKGVATYFGIMLAVAPLVGLAAGAIWLITAAVSRYSSLAALMAVGWAPAASLFLANGQAFLLSVILAALVYLRHWANIGRLKRGVETKIGQK